MGCKLFLFVSQAKSENRVKIIIGSTDRLTTDDRNPKMTESSGTGAA